VAYWRLNENGDPSTNFTGAADYVGGFNGTYGLLAQNGFNGVVGPQPPAYPNLESGNTALQTVNSYNGAAPVGNLPYVSWVVAPPLGLNTNAVTMMAWIYPTAFNEPGSAGIIFSRNPNNDVNGLDYQNNNNLGYTWNALNTT